MSGSKPTKTLKPAEPAAKESPAEAPAETLKPVEQAAKEETTSTQKPATFSCVLAGLGGTPIEVTATNEDSAVAAFREVAPGSGNTPVTVTRVE